METRAGFPARSIKRSRWFIAPLGRSCRTIRLHGCDRHCSRARSAQPSGSSQSRGIAFQSTQLCLLRVRYSTTEGFNSRSSRLPPPPNGRNHRCGCARSPIAACVRPISFCAVSAIVLLPEWHRVRKSVIADPVAFAVPAPSIKFSRWFIAPLSNRANHTTRTARPALPTSPAASLQARSYLPFTHSTPQSPPNQPPSRSHRPASADLFCAVSASRCCPSGTVCVKV